METDNKFKIYGTIEKVLPPQVISDKFTKYEFWLKTQEKFPQIVAFQASGDAFISHVQSNLSVGDAVTVHFNVGGRISNDKVFTTLKAWKIE